MVAMDDETRILIKKDKATGIASTSHGANINSVGFNLDFLVSKRPNLAVKIAEDYKEAASVQADEPTHPDEDYNLALEKLRNILGN